MADTAGIIRSHAGPLSGLRVVDLTRVVAGALATWIPGDDGAHVVKIALPGVR